MLAAFGLVALLTLIVSLLESVGRAGWALLSVAAALAGELAMRRRRRAAVPGGGPDRRRALALAVALPGAVALLGRPGPHAGDRAMDHVRPARSMVVGIVAAAIGMVALAGVVLASGGDRRACAGAHSCPPTSGPVRAHRRWPSARIARGSW